MAFGVWRCFKPLSFFLLLLLLVTVDVLPYSACMSSHWLWVFLCFVVAVSWAEEYEDGPSTSALLESTVISCLSWTIQPSEEKQEKVKEELQQKEGTRRRRLGFRVQHLNKYVRPEAVQWTTTKQVTSQGSFNAETSCLNSVRYVLKSYSGSDQTHLNSLRKQSYRVAERC